MKTIINILILLVTYGATSQQDPDLYLNSKKIDFEKTFLRSSNIKNIEVDKSTQNGQIFITTKEGVKFYCLSEIVKKFTDLGNINDSLYFIIKAAEKQSITKINDTTDVRIDSSFFIYTDVIELTDAKYLKEGFKALKIVIIDLEKEKRKPVVRIRGDKWLESTKQ